MNITLSALGPSIAEQLEEMGLEQTGAKVELLDRMADAVTLLHLHGCLTDSECSRARGRVVKLLKLRKSRGF